MAEDNEKAGAPTDDVPQTVRNEQQLDTQLQAIEKDVLEHGEIHMTVEEIDGEVELRRGQTQINHDLNLILVSDGTVVHRIDAGRVVSWYRPMGVFHN